MRRGLRGLRAFKVESDETDVLLVLGRFEWLDVAFPVGLVVPEAEVAELVVALVLS